MAKFTITFRLPLCKRKLKILFMIYEINGEKLRQMRGTMSQREIARLSQGKFTDVALCKWERGVMRPNKENVKALIGILKCKFEDIAEPVNFF